MVNKLPILYSFRHCPYAIRARMAISYVGIPVEIREAELKNKPKHLLVISPKGTVPVLQLTNGEVIEESLDIIRWALAQYYPEHWLRFGNEATGLSNGMMATLNIILIAINMRTGIRIFLRSITANRLKFFNRT